jgi:hypothetical protein
MIVTKIINGFVAQQFDTDTGKFLNQDFIGSDDRCWETKNGEPLDFVPKTANGDEPYLNMEMVQPVQTGPYPLIVAVGEDSTRSFFVGDEVVVTPLEDGSEPTEEFQGIVINIKDGRYVQVRDQDNNVFDCEPNQVQSVK